jgi:hypothetical protein
VQAAQVKVPAIVAVGILCLAIGIGIGILGMAFSGHQGSPATSVAQDSPAAPPGGAMAKGGGPPGGGGMGGPRGPSPKNQLVSLVGKLDQLTEKPLTVSLNQDQKKQVGERLKGLESQETLADEDAKTRLDALLEILKDQKETLEAAGYRWPGQRFSRPADMPNPFKDPKNGKALGSLQERLGSPKDKMAPGQEGPKKGGR